MNILTLLALYIHVAHCSVSLMPEVSQEGLLQPYTTYADVTLFHFHVPPEVVRVTWEFAAFMDDPGCPVRQVHILVQHGSYPVISHNNATLQKYMYIHKAAVHKIVTRTAYRPHNATVLPVYNPLPGSWFAAAYIPNWNEQMQQEGIIHKCRYSLGSIAMWTQKGRVKTLHVGSRQSVTTHENLSYYRFYVPSHTWFLQVNISKCRMLEQVINRDTGQKIFRWCVRSLALGARSLPTYAADHPKIANITEGGGYVFRVTRPFADGYYYLLVATEGVTKLDITVRTKECTSTSYKKLVPHLREVEATEYTVSSQQEVRFISNVPPESSTVGQGEQAIEQATEHAIEQTSEHAIEQASEHATEQASEHSEHGTTHAKLLTEHSEHGTKQASEHATEQVSEHAIEHSERATRLRPTRSTPELQTIPSQKKNGDNIRSQGDKIKSNRSEVDKITSRGDKTRSQGDKIKSSGSQMDKNRSQIEVSESHSQNKSSRRSEQEGVTQDQSVITWEEVWPNMTHKNPLVMARIMSEGEEEEEEEGEDFSDVHKCYPILPLARIKHASDFTDTFLIQGREWYSTWLSVKRGPPVFTHLTLLPFTDIGGTLSINILLDELLMNATRQLITVIGCVRKGRPPDVTHDNMECEDEQLTLNVTSHSKATVEDLILIPFPEPDTWYLALQLVCYDGGIRVSCIVSQVMVSLDVRTQPCVFSGENPCGEHGVCQETHRGMFFFTSCVCREGWRGWGCEDGNESHGWGSIVTGVCLLTLSNIFFLPPAVVALRRKLYSQALLFTATMIASVLYHACDNEVVSYCVTKYEVLQFTDFFFSLLCFWVTVVGLGGVGCEYRPALHTLGVIIIAPAVQYSRTALASFTLPMAVAGAIPVCHVLYRRWWKGSWPALEPRQILYRAVGLTLALIGLIMFALLQTKDNYKYVHSSWHMVIALSLVFLLPSRHPAPRTPQAAAALGPHLTHTHTTPTLPSDDAELIDVGEATVDYTASSLVFHVTSDVDFLLNDDDSEEFRTADVRNSDVNE